jgi:hypothetical protein
LFLILTAPLLTVKLLVSKDATPVEFIVANLASIILTPLTVFAVKDPVAPTVSPVKVDAYAPDRDTTPFETEKKEAGNDATPVTDAVANGG